MTEAGLIIALKSEIKSLSSKFDDADYESAIDDAERETWSLPQTDDFKVLWLKKRSKRHLFSFLMHESADTVDAKVYKLGSKFKHWQSLIKDMDKEFVEALADNPDKFANVDAYKLFGTQVNAGFATDFLGRDLTYGEDNEVIHTPED